MILSAVILTRNSENYIDKCLSSLISSIPVGVILEIFVIDNGSTDNTLRSLEKYEHNITLIKLEKNYGTTFSRNLGLKKCAGKFIAIIDSDIEIINLNWRFLFDDFTDGIGLVAPRLYYPTGFIQNSVKKFPLLHWRLMRLLNIFFGLNFKNQEYYEKLSIITYPDVAISAFWLISKEALIEVGLLDEKIFYSPEDVDFCMRLWKSGYCIKYAETGRIIHHTQQISHKKPFSFIAISFFFNLLYYFMKHRYFFSNVGNHKMKLRALEKYGYIPHVAEV